MFLQQLVSSFLKYESPPCLVSRTWKWWWWWYTVMRVMLQVSFDKKWGNCCHVTCALALEKRSNAWHICLGQWYSHIKKGQVEVMSGTSLWGHRAFQVTLQSGEDIGNQCKRYDCHLSLFPSIPTTDVQLTSLRLFINLQLSLQYTTNNVLRIHSTNNRHLGWRITCSSYEHLPQNVRMWQFFHTGSGVHWMFSGYLLGHSACTSVVLLLIQQLAEYRKVNCSFAGNFVNKPWCSINPNPVMPVIHFYCKRNSKIVFYSNREEHY